MSEDRRVPSILLAAMGLLVLSVLPLGAMWAARLGPGALAGLAAFGLYFLAVHVYLPFRLYLAARDDGADSGRAAAWAGAAFVVPVVVFLAYVLRSRRAG